MGCDVFLHSCGKIDLLMPKLIEWGVDGFDFDSPRTIGYEDMKEFRGKIMLWGCLDLQHYYSKGCKVTPAKCEEEVWTMIKNMGTPEGGFGAYLYPQPYHLGTPKKIIRAFEKGLKKYGTYSQIPPQKWNDL